jgi:hypothetical protein
MRPELLQSEPGIVDLKRWLSSSANARSGSRNLLATGYSLFPVLFAEDADFGLFIFGVDVDTEILEVVDQLFEVLRLNL